MNKPVLIFGGERKIDSAMLEGSKLEQYKNMEWQALLEGILHKAAESEDVFLTSENTRERIRGKETTLRAKCAFVDLEWFQNANRRPEGFQREDMEEILEEYEKAESDVEDNIVDRVMQEKDDHSPEELKEIRRDAQIILSQLYHRLENILREKAMKEWICP